MAAGQTQRGVPLSTLNPKFLHTNSTSHTWPFSAIAELIDNAYDVNAKQIWIDKIQIKDQECLTFMDNGNGLSYDMMHQMLSFGFSDKKAVRGKHPIGMYGNGFKSGSMRLGQDAIVLSKSKTDLCVGMLSQTYLKKTRAEQITVPIISIKKPDANNVLEEHRASLRAILDHSPFNTKEELLTELQNIEFTGSSTGTRIIIWNLRRTSAGHMEFDFTTDRYDIRIPSDVLESTTEPDQRPERSDSSIRESDFSLRAYCSILYLKPCMQINIRGKKVETQLISGSLEYIKKCTYTPMFVNEIIPITFGYNKMSKDQYGIMMYYKNRLIKAYHSVGCLRNVNNGIGVIGVIECNFLKPTHNKQDFDYSDEYRKTTRNVAEKLRHYCRELRSMIRRNIPSDAIPFEETTMKRRQPTTPQSLSKRKKQNSDERNVDVPRNLRSTTYPPTPNLAYTNEMEKLILKVKQLEEEKASISAECENAKSSLVKLEEEMASISAAHEETKTSLTELQTKLQQLEEEKASISAKCENAKSSVKELQTKVKQLEEEKASISAECENAKSSVNELQTKVKQLEKEKASISADCENAKSSLTELKNKMAALVNGTK